MNVVTVNVGGRTIPVQVQTYQFGDQSLSASVEAGIASITASIDEVEEIVADGAASVAASVTAAQTAETNAETAETNAEAAEAAAETARDAAVAAQNTAGLYRDEAAAYVSAIPPNITYDTDAAGRTGVGVDGGLYWLRTTDGLRLKTRVTSTTSADVTVSSNPIIIFSLNGIYTRFQYIKCVAGAVTSGNNYTITPVDTSIRYSGTGTQYIWEWEAPAVNDQGSGSVIVTIANGAGTTFFSANLHKRGNTALTGSEFQQGDLLSARRQTPAEDVGQRLLWMAPPNSAVRELAPLVRELDTFGKMPSASRPLHYYKSGIDQHTMRMRITEDKYAAGQSRRASNMIQVVEHDMATFQADTGNCLSMNSIFTRAKGRLCDDLNMMFDALSRGSTVDTGRVPTTLETPVIGGKFGDPVGLYTIAGAGHGYLIAPTTTLGTILNDSTTGTITAVTKANPMVVSMRPSLYAVGDVFTPRGVTGMTEIDGVPLTVTAVGTTVAGVTPLTIGAVNSTGYGTFTGHTGGCDIAGTINPDADITTAFYGSRIVKTMSAKAENLAHDVYCRPTWVVTYDPDAYQQIRFQHEWDFTHADVTVTPGFLRGFSFLFAATDLDMCQPIVNGVPQTPIQIDLRDLSDTVIGFPEEVIFWNSDQPEKQWVITNNYGYGYTHKENGVLVANSIHETYIDNFDWGIKLYGGLFGDHTGTTPRNMTGIVVTMDMGIRLQFADPIT